MLIIAELTQSPLKWQQPSMRQEFELVTRDTPVASLNFRSSFSSLGTAQSGEGSWTFKRIGFWQNKAYIRAAGSETDLAIYTRNTWQQGGTLEFADGHRYVFKTNFWMTRMGWWTETGQPLVNFQIGGFFRHSAEVEVLPIAYHLPQIPLLVLFGWYAVLMLYRDSSAAAAA